MTGKTSTRKRTVVYILVISGISTLGWGGYQAMQQLPPPWPTTPEEALAVIDSSRYDRLPEYRQREYRIQAGILLKKMPQEKRREIFRSNNQMHGKLREVFREQMVQKAIDFANADLQQREVLIDMAINEWNRKRGQHIKQGRKQRGNKSATDPHRNERLSKFKAHLQDRFQHGNPQENALIGEYFRAIKRRHKQP